MAVSIGIIVFPGSNCDHDAYYALKHELGVDTRFIWHKETEMDSVDGIVIPGGFSYGDYLRSGAIARFSPVMKEVEKFAENGGPVLGICNGFQVLLEAGLLPGTMMHNEQLKFSCRMIHISCKNSNTLFTSGIDRSRVLKLPIAHGEGNYFASDDELKRLYDQNQIVFTYTDENGNPTPDANPNGSVENIAGVCNQKGNILGMMPHPERAVDPTLGSDDGKIILNTMLNSLEPS